MAVSVVKAGDGEKGRAECGAHSFGRRIVGILLCRWQAVQAHVWHGRSETRWVRDEKDRFIEIAGRRLEEIGDEAQGG
jgi:hypothetical protein